MAKANVKLIHAIRNTAKKLLQHAPYQWGHMGSCNCGHLAQEITQVSKSDIHRFAMHSEGSWTDQSRTYCATSGLPMDLLISAMLDYGLEIKDLEYLEKLSDPSVLRTMGLGSLRYNQRDDVIKYLESWANCLEENLLAAVSINELTPNQPEIQLTP